MNWPENSDGVKDHPSTENRKATAASRRRILILVLIFFTALGVRLLNWQSHRTKISEVQTYVVLNYKHLAKLIYQNGLASLYSASSPTSNPDLLGHPPGYPILLSFLYKLFPESDSAVQIFQAALDSLCAVIVFLLAVQLLPTGVGTIAGLMAALAPQFSWNSIQLLPDSMAALPILLAIYLIALTRDRPRILLILIAGMLIGVSCWLRANALLLAPFTALLFPVIFKRGQGLRAALTLIGGACLVIAPLTIRNAVVFGKFIPVSLGAGQTLIEGIADYDTDGSLGLPQTDIELIRDEAITYNRPDYANSLFTPNGVQRDRARTARGLAVIRAHPLWFAGVMVRRAASMLRLERTPLRLEVISSGDSTRLFHSMLRGIQKLFITAIILPFVLAGASILIYRRHSQTLAILLVVPFYYFCTQSALHTEYRYVLVMHYFLFVLAALAVYTIACKIKRSLTKPGRA
jgi:4-amino-4-deoxy-L-arabinose transferase-like glycosyltransferase